MGQFDVYRNDNPDSCRGVPHLLDIQTDFLELLATGVVVPLVLASEMRAAAPAQGEGPVTTGTSRRDHGSSGFPVHWLLNSGSTRSGQFYARRCGSPDGRVSETTPSRPAPASSPRGVPAGGRDDRAADGWTGSWSADGMIGGPGKLSKAVPPAAPEDPGQTCPAACRFYIRAPRVVPPKLPTH